jgi:hypothetical protein
VNAAALAERGWAVFPCRPGDKRPAVADWENRASASPDLVARYWPSPRHNVGIACGPSLLVVIDLDAHGDLPADWQLPGVNDGKDVFAAICEWAGMDWPFGTYTVATPSGGWHMYFRAPEDRVIRNSASRLGPQVDVRAAGGYVVGPGSVTPAGTYEALDDDADVEPLPPWIARLLEPDEPERPPVREMNARDTHKRVNALQRAVCEARPGTRNSMLFWAACTLAEFSPDDLPLLTYAASQAGLDDREINRTIASARRRVLL